MGAGGAAAARRAAATKASGAIVKVAVESFADILKRSDAPLVVVARGGVFRRDFRYLTSYKGLLFYAKSDAELVLPSRCEIVVAKKIWVPE